MCRERKIKQIVRQCLTAPKSAKTVVEEKGMNTEANEVEQEQIKKNVLSRMKRIEGQVRGISRMIDDGKECEEILVQVRAVRSALQSANKLILKRYMLKCHAETVQNTNPDESLEKFIKVLTGFIEG
jgi:DNA-binding FrmR family transcriptional regulator